MQFLVQLNGGVEQVSIHVQGIGIVAYRGADSAGEGGRIRGCIDAGRGSDASQDRSRIGTERIVVDERDVAAEIGEDVRVGRVIRRYLSRSASSIQAIGTSKPLFRDWNGQGQPGGSA